MIKSTLEKMKLSFKSNFKLLLSLLFLFINRFSLTESRTNLLTNNFKEINSTITNKFKSPFSSSHDLPVNQIFKFPTSPSSTSPSSIPSSNGNFGKGTIDLGGLEVTQVSISKSDKVWTAYEGGPDNMGFSIFEPLNLPQGFFKLGIYAQSNNRQLFGWILLARDISGTSLRSPIDYIEVGNTESFNIKHDSFAYFWQPVCPSGYLAIGLTWTGTFQKPMTELQSISCVRSDLTEKSEADKYIWGINGITVSSLRPVNRGTEARGVYTGTFTLNQQNFPNPSLFCLKNMKFDMSNMPNDDQFRVLYQKYSPLIYFHPNEEFLPSSVNWFFDNGALLYKKGEESNPSPIKPNGLNLPQGGFDDDLFWLDYPVDKNAKENIKRGYLNSTKVYIHIKPMYGATFTDIVIWLFYPFNGNAHLKFLFIKNLSLRNIGEHIGDWEHVTLRISNFNGELWRVFFAEHSGGRLVEASDLEFQDGNSKPVMYSSLHGHAMFPKPGLVLQGGSRNGLRNDMEKSDKVLDCGVLYEVIAGPGVVEPEWVNYYRKWGPHVRDKIGVILDGIDNMLPKIIQKLFRKVVNKIPIEMLQEDGPTGPKVKRTWSDDE